MCNNEYRHINIVYGKVVYVSQLQRKVLNLIYLIKSILSPPKYSADFLLIKYVDHKLFFKADWYIKNFKR